MNRTSRTQPLPLLAQEHTIVFSSRHQIREYAYSPGLVRLPGGRLLATLDVGCPMEDAFGENARFRGEIDWFWGGRIFTSDDQGRSWTFRGSYPFMHARPFVAGERVYILGHCGDLAIVSSQDEGVTWSKTALLTKGQSWHQAPTNVLVEQDRIYLVMERRTSQNIQAWYPGELAPVLMRASQKDDLSLASSWTFATELTFRDLIPGVEEVPAIDYFGVPFFECPYPRGSTPSPDRVCAPMGWLEANVARISDPGHYWYDPSGKTIHLLLRAHTGGTGFGCLAKVLEKDDGTMETTLETVPSGKKILFLPVPGGQMKFHLLFDELTRLYWLLSSQSRDSMTRSELLPSDRFNLPNNERQFLQLHFSKNLVDWCFAGRVCEGGGPSQSRHYASMAIDGENLHLLSRSGNCHAESAHEGNVITFHTISNFRSLAY